MCESILYITSASLRERWAYGDYRAWRYFLYRERLNENYTGDISSNIVGSTPFLWNRDSSFQSLYRHLSGIIATYILFYLGNVTIFLYI